MRRGDRPKKKTKKGEVQKYGSPFKNNQLQTDSNRYVSTRLIYKVNLFLI